MPPPSTAPGNITVLPSSSEATPLARLKALAEKDLTDEEIIQAAGDEPSLPSDDKVSVIAKLRGKLSDIKKKRDGNSKSQWSASRSSTEAEVPAGMVWGTLLERLAAKKSKLTVPKTSSTTAKSSDAADDSGSAASSLLPLGSSDDEAPDEDAVHHSDKKSKKKKKRRRRSRRKRSSSGSASSKASAPSSDNSSGSSELFREAGSSTNGLASRVSLTATRRPGRLLHETLQAMVISLNPLAPKLKSKRPAVVLQCLQKALAPQVRLGLGTYRELATLSRAAD